MSRDRARYQATVNKCHLWLPTAEFVVLLLAARYNFFVLEVLKAWIDAACKYPRTIHHMGRGAFMVAGRTIKLPSRVK